MAKRANKRRADGTRKRASAAADRTCPRRGAGAACDGLEDPFFYESPFPPEVELEAEVPAPTYTAEMIARRRKLRTFVAMVVGVAVTITLLGIGRSMVEEREAQPRSMTVPVSP